MKKEEWIKRILLGFLFLVILLGSYYIWNFNNAKSDRLSNKNQNNITQNQGNANQNQQNNKAAQVPEDVDMETQLRQEKEVKYGHVYVDKSLAFAPIIINDGVTKEDAQKLVEKYAGILKTKYPDREVSVIAQNLNGDKIASLIK